VIGTLRRYPVHPAAEIFPMLSREKLRELAEDIAEQGLVHPIVLFDGQVLDGRNRAAACEIANVTPRYETLEECQSPAAYVLSANKHRRQLTKSQEAMVATKMLGVFEAEAKERQRLSDGRGEKGSTKLSDLNSGSPAKLRAVDAAAEAVGVSPTYVSQAKRLSKNHPQLAKLIDDGKLNLNQAEKLASLPDGERLDATLRISKGEPAKKVLAPPKSTRHPGKSGRTTEQLEDLDDRVRRLHEDGLGTKEIADQLEESRHTVQHIKCRLGLTRARRTDNPVAGLLKYAIEFADAWEPLVDRMSKEDPSRAEEMIGRADDEQVRELEEELARLDRLTKKLRKKCRERVR